MKLGTLYIVATPIGNLKDFTLRSLDILRSVDAVVCEELRQGSTLLKRAGIQGKLLLTLNEHNEAEQIPDLLLRLSHGESLALISDSGTPIFADPGVMLLEQAIVQGIKVVPIPGPSSLTAALSVSPISMREFIFAGFLPRKDDERLSKLKSLKSLKLPLVLLDTPYRLGKLMNEVEKVFGKGHVITLALDLTLPDELILHGTVNEIQARIQVRKGEFVLIVHR